VREKSFEIRKGDNPEEITEWINKSFDNGNGNRSFEANVVIREFSYDRIGRKIYLE